MRFDDFCEFVQVIVLDEMQKMYDASTGREWPEIESVLRKRLDLNKAFRSGSKKDSTYMSELSDSETELYDELKAVRRKLAGKEQLPAYVIFSNRTLMDMCRTLPFTMEELRALRGVGLVNSEKYGRDFLDAIHAYILRHGEGKKTNAAAGSL